MKSRIYSLVSLILVLSLTLLLGGCGQKTIDVDISSTVSKEEPVVHYNPLTGLPIEQDALNLRPVALMINNISVAQPVQTGLNDADIIYEAYAEGGITRLLAVFKDISKVGNIGTIRSARYSHIDLAVGHDAIYVHAGKNETHAAPHMKELGLDNFDLGARNYGFRVKNGKAYEHTLYTSGEKLTEGFEKYDYRRELKTESGNWQSFVSADKPVTPDEGACDEVSVTMSSSYITKFKYDASTGRYTRYSGSTERKDYRTGESVTVKNVLVLKTTTKATGNKSGIVLTGLEGGEGYYISNGGYQTVKWSKGSAKNPLKITLADGSDCPYNPGNTWVCLVDKKNSVKVTPGATVSSTTATTSK